jgi:polyphosphate kinase 2 (PPK2 family)
MQREPAIIGTGAALPPEAADALADERTFCTDGEHRAFLRQAPDLDRNLVRSGVHLIKLWFSVSRDEQQRRFKERGSTR